MRSRISILAVVLALGCRKPTPKCEEKPDAGTAIETPCVGRPNGERCCLGAHEGVCASGRCDVGGSP